MAVYNTFMMNQSGSKTNQIGSFLNQSGSVLHVISSVQYFIYEPLWFAYKEYKRTYYNMSNKFTCECGQVFKYSQTLNKC